MTEDHREQEHLAERVVVACRGGDAAQIGSAWARLQVHVLAHFDAEERHLIPVLLQTHPRVAAAILAEHRHLRMRLGEIGAGGRSVVVNCRAVQAFADEIRAHAAHEERLFYRWADEKVTDSVRESLVQSLEAAPSTDSSADSSSST